MVGIQGGHPHRNPESSMGEPPPQSFAAAFPSQEDGALPPTPLPLSPGFLQSSTPILLSLPVSPQPWPLALQTQSSLEPPGDWSWRSDVASTPGCLGRSPFLLISHILLPGTQGLASHGLLGDFPGTFKGTLHIPATARWPTTCHHRASHSTHIPCQESIYPQCPDPIHVLWLHPVS